MWRKPVWTEGLFVSQHHFQVQDRYHEGLLRDRLASLRRFDWGITELEIDDRMLQAGQLSLRRFYAVWPDGQVVRCGEATGDPLPQPRPFDGLLRGDATPLDVYVAMTSEGASNVSLNGEPSVQQRFMRVTQRVDDFNSGGSAQDVDVAVPSLRILYGSEPRERVTTMQVAQLVRQADGRIVLRDTYVPPVMSLSASPFLSSGLRRVVGAMTARQRELSSQRKQRHPSSIEFHFTDARRFWLLHTLNSQLPILSHMLDAQRVHPEEVFLQLSSLVGELCTFAPDADPTSLPKFAFGELGDVFEHLFARALALLSVDSAPVYAEIPLERRPDGMFLGKIPEPRLINQEFFVAIRSSMSEQLMRERVPQLLKVAGWKHISDVVKQARHGVRSEVEWSPAAALPVKPGTCFFRLRREGPFWEEIAKTSTIALYLPADADWKDTWLAVYAIEPTFLR